MYNCRNCILISQINSFSEGNAVHRKWLFGRRGSLDRGLPLPGELIRFQPGVSMAISWLDAWYSNGSGSVESTAAYKIRGLCRRCCLPETILRSMQACIALSAAGDSLDNCDKLVELVGSAEPGMMHLFSQQQLQVPIVKGFFCSLIILCASHHYIKKDDLDVFHDIALSTQGRGYPDIPTRRYKLILLETFGIHIY